MKLFKYSKWFAIGIVLLISSKGLAQPVNANGGSPGAFNEQFEAQDLTGKRGQEQVDLFTGSFGYSIPINCPPARNGTEPPLALTYSSGGENDWCGMGWKLEIGYIERNTKDGFPIQFTSAAIPAPATAYDDTKGFLLEFSGKEYKLFSVATNSPIVEYRAETDTDFLRCLLNTTSDTWTVYDKSGNAYLFGQSASSRVSNPKSGWSGASGTFHWGLDEIDSVTGDKTTVGYTTYTDPQGVPERTIYPTNITYNSHINLNGYSQAYTGLNTISFGTELRPDRRTSFRSGFRTEQNRRLTNIVCQVNGQSVWRYALGYTTSTATGRSLLSTVTAYGADNTTALPVQTFSYQQNPNGVSFGSTIQWTNMILSDPNNAGSTDPYLTELSGAQITVADLVDIDGDGLPDRVVYDSGSPDSFRVQRNLGNGGFGPTYFFGPTASSSSSTASDSNPIPNGGYYSALNGGYGRMLDINGDGYLDKVADYWKHFSSIYYATTPYTNFAVMLNNGSNYGSAFFWPVATNDLGTDPNSFMSCIESGTTQPYVGLFDINGDGRPDRVVALYNQAETYFKVQLNTGTNFSSTKLFGPYRSQNYTNAAYGIPWSGINTPEATMIDINGDGLPDRVMIPMNPSSVPSPMVYGNPNFNFFAVEYNDGYSFESTNTSSAVPGAFDRWPGVVLQSGAQPYNYDAIQNLPVVGLFDLNGDGLPDRVMLDETAYSQGVAQWLVYLNNGTGFNTTPIQVPINNQGVPTSRPWDGVESSDGNASGSVVTTLMDINGDGLLDRVMKVYDNGFNNANTSSNFFLVQLNNGPFPDLLTNISNGLGGSYAIKYKPSTAYDNSRVPGSPNLGSELPNIYQTVSSVTEIDGVNPARTTSYGYSGGFWDGNRREFHGFATVSVTNPPSPISAPYNRVAIHYFQQGGGQDHSTIGKYLDAGAFAKEGMEYRTETYGNDGNLYHVTINQVNQASLGNARYFPYVQATFDCDYPGPRITATQFAYDLNTENLTNKVEYGEVTNFNPNSVGSFTFRDVDSTDNRFYNTHYATISGNSYIVDHPDTANLMDSGNNVIRETKYTYNSSSGTLSTKLSRIAPNYYATNSYGNYNAYGLVGLITDPIGVQTEIGYDSTYTFKTTSRVRVYPNSDTSGDLTTSDSYDARSGLISSSMAPTGVSMTNTYDALYRLKETDTVPNDGSSLVWKKRYGYNFGVITSGNAVSYIDETNNDGVGGVQTRTYVDGFQRPIQMRIQGENNNFRVVSGAYDERGNLFISTWPTFGTSAAFVKPTGSTQTATWTGYDALGRAATNRLVTVTFDGNGAFSSKTDLAGDTTGNASPLGAKTVAYANGSDPWWIICTDEDGKVRRYQLDAFGRTNQVQEVDGSSIYTNLLKYDLANDLTNIVNANGENIYFAFDNAGVMVAMADPYLGQWTYQRDFAGRLRVQTDGRGDVISNSYINPITANQDPLGRVRIKTVFSFNPTNQTLVPAYTNTYVFDSSNDGNYVVYNGLLYQTFDNQGWEKNSYDDRGRLVKTTRHLNIKNQDYTTSYTYNDADDITSTVYPNSGPIITNSYFTGGSLKQVSRSGGTENYYTVAASGYDEFEDVTNFSYGNSVTTTRAYYPVSKRLKTISAGSSGGVFNRTFTYSAADDVTSLSGTGMTNTITMSYDNLHRIKTYTGLTGNYSYDAAGNMTANIESGTSQAYDYGARRGQAVKTIGGKKYLYDLCGNMIVRRADTNSSQSLVYDPENRLVRVAQVETNFTLAQFGYAADGTRLWKWFNQSPTNLQIWIGDIYEEKGGKVLFHVFAGEQQVCTFETNSVLFGGSDTNRVADYYHEDELNSSCVLSSGSSTGTQQETNVYYPFGRNQVASPQATFTPSRQFTGQIKDDETGLYYYNARYYDPEIGRFIQADTIISDLGSPQSYNRYSYVLNNPLRYTDPTGHEDTYTGASGRALLQDEDAQATKVVQGARQSAGTMAAVMKTVVAVTPAGTAMNAGEAITGKEEYSGAQLSGGQQAESGVMAALPGVLKVGGKLLRAGKAAMTAARGVWALDELERGIAIENRLAKSDYKDWFRVGSLNNGKFPLVDFQKGNNLLSLKTVDTTTSGWLGKMQAHIDDLGDLGHTVDGQPAHMILDIRVQPGGAKAAKQLINYGKKHHVTVIISEIK